MAEANEAQRRRLEVFPADRQAFDGLVDTLTQAGDWPALARLHEQRIEALVDRPEAVTLRLALARLQADRLGDREGARKTLALAHALDPENSEILAGLIAAAEADEDWPVVATLTERLAKATEDAAGAADLLIRLGDLATEKLERPEAGLSWYEKALERQPEHAEARTKAWRSAAALGRYGAAVALLEGAGEGFGEAWLELGRRLVEEPWHRDAARRCLSKAEAEGAEEAKTLLASLDEQAKTWRQTARDLRADAVEAREKKKAAEAYLRIAQLHALYDDDAEKVIENIDRVFMLGPSSPVVLDFLEGWYGQREDHTGLVATLERLADTVKDRKAAARIRLRMAAVQETRLGDREAAAESCRKALDLDPGDAAAADRLLSALEAKGAWEEAGEVLERRLAATADRESQRRLRLALGRLHLHHQNDDARARSHLEAAFALDRLDLEVCAELEPLLRESEAHARLAEVLEARLAGRLEPDVRRRLLDRLSELQLGPLNQVEDGLRTLGRLLVLDPGKERLVKRLEEAATSAKRPDLLARALGIAASVAEGDARKPLLLALGQVWEKALSDGAGAAAIYRELLEQAPGDSEARAGLERALALTGSHEELTEALEAKVRDATGDALKAARLELARHHLERTGRIDEAGRLYSAILDVDPGDTEALDRLADVQERQEDHAGVAATLERRLSRHDGETHERLALQMRLARLFADRLEKPEEAAELYCRVFETDPARSGVTGALESLLSRGIGRSRIAAILAPHYAGAGDWPRHLQMLEHGLADLEAPAERAALLVRMAKVHEDQLVDRRQAFTAYARAFAETPEDPALLEELERLASAGGAFDELAATLSEVLDKGDAAGLSPGRAQALRLRLAALREEDLDDPKGAAEAYRQVAETTEADDPAHRQSLEALARMAEQAEQWPDLADSLRRLAELGRGGPEEGDLLLRLGVLTLERLDDAAEAARLLEAARAAGAADQAVLPPLCQALQGAGRAEDLSTVLAERIALAESAGEESTASKLKLERARLLSEGLGQQDEAIATWRAILEERPQDPDARASLEACLEDPAQKLNAARALAPAYERAQEHQKLVAALEVEVAAVEEAGAGAAQLLRRISRIQERDLRSQALALATLARAVKADPSDRPLREELKRLADEAGAPETVPEVLEGAAETLDGEAAAEMLLEAGEWAEQRLGERSEAIGYYRKTLGLVPGLVGALEPLHRLLRAEEAWPELTEICMALADRAEDDGERRRLWREAGRIHEEQTEDLAAAAAAHRRILESDATDLEAARVLDRLYQALDRPEDLAWVLELARQQAAGTERHRELTFRLAELRRTRLGDLDSALDMFRGLLEEDPGHRLTRQALDGLVSSGGVPADRAVRLLDPCLATSGEHRGRVALREARLARADAEEMPEARRAELYAEMRRIQEQEMEAPELAFMSACRQLEAGVAFDVARDEAERLARAAGTVDALCEVYDEIADGLEAGDGRKIDLLRRAATLKTEADNAEEAIEAWKKLQALVPEDRSVLDALEKLHQARQDAAHLVEIYRQKVDLAAGAQERTESRLELARLLEQTGAFDGAIEAYEVAAAESAAAPELARKALEQLDRLYGRAERWQDLSRVLAGMVKLLAGEPERQKYMLRLAELFEKRDAHPARALEIHAAVLKEAGEGSAEAEGAVQGLERLMAEDETRVKAAAILEPVYRQREDARPLIDTLEARLTATRAVADRLALLEEIAGLYEERLGQKPLAFMVWCRAFREKPEHEGVGERLEVLAKETEGWEELVGVYEDEIERLGDNASTLASRLQLHQRLSEVYERHLAQADKALQQQRRAVALAPDDALATRRLADLLERYDERTELVGIWRRLVDLVEDTDEKLGLWRRIAEATETLLEDKEGAVAAWREVLALASERPEADVLEKLARLHGELEDWPSLAEVYGREIALAEAAGDDGRAAEWHHRLGRVRGVRLGDPVGAAESHARCLELDSEHEGAFASLEEILAAGPDAEGAAREGAARAAALLEPRYAAAGDGARRIQALEILASTAEDGEHRAAHLVALADVHQGEGQSPELAFMAVSRALQAEPERKELLERLAALSEEAELQEEEADLLEGLITDVRDESARAMILRRFGGLRAEAGEVTEAIEAFKSLLELVPGDAEALDRLARLTRLDGDHEMLVEVLRQQLAAADVESRRIAILRQIAALQEEHLGNAEAALSTWRQVLDSAPDDREALARVDALCVRAEQWTDLEAILGREAEVAAAAGDVAAQVDFLFRLAEVRTDRLDDPGGALDLYREILRLAPGHPDTVAYLEEILEGDKHRVDVARVLEEVYRRQERWDRLLSTLESRAATEPDPEVRREVLWEMHELQERELDSPDMAFIVLCRAFNEDPTAERVRRSLERLADVTDQHEELVAVYEDALDEVTAEPVILDMRTSLARIHEERLHDHDRALELWGQVIAAAPDDPLPALQALDRLYRRKERWEELADVLDREASLLEGDDKVSVLFRLGQLCADTLDAPDRAAGVYEALLEIEPGHVPAMRGLEQLYEQAGAHEKLAANLEAQLAASTEPAARERLTGRLADVVGTRLGETDRAIALWQEVLESNKRSDAALTALEMLYEKAERWTDLAALLRQRLEKTVDPREVTRLSARLGWVLGTRLGEAEDAIRNFKSVLERDPRNEQALEALWEIYDVQGAWEDLVVVLKRLAPLQDGPNGLRKVRFRLAEVLGRELGRTDEAVEMARRFLDVEPHVPEALEALEGLLRELEAKAEAVKVMELRARALAREADAARALLAEEKAESSAGAVAAGAEDMTVEVEGDVSPASWGEDPLADPARRLAELDEARIALLFEIARAHDEELEKPVGGAAALDEILLIAPANRDAYRALRALYESAERWRDLAALLDRFLPHVEDDEEKKDILVEIAGLQEVRLGQKELAFMSLGRAFAADPEDLRIEQDLLRLAEETDAWDEVAAILEEVVDEIEKGPRLAALLLRFAEVQNEHLDDADEAESAIRKVLAFDPGNPAALDALAGLFSNRGQASELIVALEQKLDATGEPDAQKDILGRIAAIFENELDDIEEAISTWRRVLALDGGDATGIDALVRIFEGRERWDDLVGVLQRAVDAAKTPSERADLQHRIAQIFEERLEDDERAIGALRAALDFHGSHAPSMTTLERIYTRLERWSELLQTYEAQAEAIDSDEERVQILLRIAALQEDQFDKPEKAIEALDRLLAIEADHGKALRDLAGLLRQTEQWERFIEASEKLIGLAHDPGEAIRLHLEVGAVWETQLGRHEKAEQIFSHALEIDPESRAALRALGELYEKSGNWVDALSMMEREAKVAGVGEEAVTLQHRMGHIHLEMLLDRGRAKTCFERAIELDPGHLASRRALKEIAEQDEDWSGYLDALVEEARHTDDLAEKTRLLHQAGLFLRDKQDDRDGALKFFEEALEKTEDDLGAAEAAAAIHLEQENLDRAEALLTIVCQKYEEAGEEAGALCRHWYKLAYVRQKLGRQEPALEAFNRAYGHDATYLPALEGLGASLVATERWDEALKIFQTILIHHRDSVTDLEVVEYYWQLGEINGKLGQHDRAVKNYEKALEIDPGHEPSLMGIIRRLEALDRWDDAVEYRHQLVDLYDGDEKYEMYLAIGRHAHDKLGDPYQAIDAYMAAHRMRPDAVAPLDSLRVLYRETKQSAKRAETLQRLLDHPEVQADKAKLRLYHFALAELLRDELKDTEGALKHFEATLDADFTYAKAFEGIEAILSKHKRYPDLEQAYVRMIQRIPKTAKTHAVRMGLWRTLGELYRQVLRSLDGAIAAYQVVCKGDPDDAEAIETLAELLAQKPGAESDAVRAFHQALKVTTEPVRVARAMLRLYSAEKSYDKAYSVAAVINDLLGDAQPDEETLYKRLKPYAKDNAKRSMSDRLWEQQLYHEKLKGPVAEIFAIVYEQAGGEITVDAKDLGLNPRKDRVDVASSMLYFANMYRYVGQVLGMEGVPLFQRQDQTEGLAVAGTFPAALVASEEMMGRSRKKELWFTISKAMAFTRPELVLGRLHGLEELELILQSTVSLVNQRFRVTHDPREVQKLQRKLHRALSPDALQAIAQAVSRWKTDNVLGDLRAYAEGVEHTANRAGILMCGDVGIAKACLMEDRGGAAKLPLRSKVRELVMFCLSEEYFALREALGLAVEIQTQARTS
jgi:golgin subfamily B member 1